MTAAVPAQIGKYRVLRLLGSGGMGRVYLAEDPDIGRQVAIKRVTLGADPQARERFIREAQTMGRLNHPNIVTLLEYGVDADTPFLVLEFLSGEDLSQWMLRPQRLRDQLGVMLGIAEALAAAHRMGVLHRDLKPENVRVLEDGRCKLLDFGIAQSGGAQLTASGYFVGTPEFVAPEVMAGAAHTAAADIYAFGLLCYVLLCGDNPFRGDTVQATVARVVQRDAPRLDKRLGGLPAGPADLIHACLAKQPELRPANAGQLIGSLQQIRAGVAADALLRELPQAGGHRAAAAGGALADARFGRREDCDCAAAAVATVAAAGTRAGARRCCSLVGTATSAATASADPGHRHGNRACL